MTVVLVLAALAALVVYEVRADRKVRRSTAGATPVVIVRGLRPRWWRRLAAKAVSGALSLAFLAGLLLAALHLHGSGPITDYSHPTAPATTTPSRTPPAPAHTTAPHKPSQTSTTRGH